MITFHPTGSFKKTNSFIERCLDFVHFGFLDRYGQMGVRALVSATPKETGETANSWYYKIERTEKTVSIVWCNSHVEDNVSIAIILQYGHGTGNGGYVVGKDYINPAIQPIFDKIANEAWKEVVG